MVEKAVEMDDDVMMAYLDGEEPSEEDLIRCIRKGACAMKFVPVLCGSAFKNKGVQPMLDAVLRYLPAPTDVPPVEGTDVDDKEKKMHRKASDDEPLSA